MKNYCSILYIVVGIFCGLFVSSSFAATYTVQQITRTDPGYDNLRPMINASGDVLFVRDLNPGGGSDHELFLYSQGKETQISTNFLDYGTVPAYSNYAMNDNGDVVWVAENNELWMYSNNSAQRIASAHKVIGSPDINNSKHVVFSRHSDYALMLYSGGKASVLYDTDPTTGHAVNCLYPNINNNGDIVWERHDPDPSSGRHDIYMYSDGKASAITNDDDMDTYPLLNESGDIVWLKGEHIYLYDGTSPMQITNDSNNSRYASDLYSINDNGEVAWSGNGNIHLYSEGKTTTLTSITPEAAGWYFPQINNDGYVVFQKETSGLGIFLYDGSGVSQVDELSNGLQARINSNGAIVWQGYHQGWEIFSAVPKAAAENTYYLPYCPGPGDLYWLGLGMTNEGAGTASVLVKVMDGSGTVASTETVGLNAGGQTALMIGDDLTQAGWVTVESDQLLTGLAFLGSLDSPGFMANIPFASQTSTKMRVPHVAQDSQWDTAVLLSNPGSSAAEVTLAFFNADGSAGGTKNVTLQPLSSSRVELSDFVTDAPKGSLLITSTQGINAFALYNDLKSGGYNFAGITPVPLQQ